MTTFSPEQTAYLDEVYAKLKKRIIDVDEKYSLVAGEPHLDMPDSLNLVKLVFTPKSPTELSSIAEQRIAPQMLSKQRSVDSAYSSKLKSLSQQKDKINNDTFDKMDAAAADFEREKAEILRKVIDNGLYFSTVANKYNDLASKRYSETLGQLTDDNKQRQKAIAQQQTDAEQLYNEQCQSLQEERTARIADAYQKLTEEQREERTAIEKYNNTLEEKEQKYQASKAKAYETARRAEVTRALESAKIYSELGEVGFRRMIESEKYSLCIDAFVPLNRSEAQYILSLDSFLQSHLGTYYDAFVDWCNTVLANS